MIHGRHNHLESRLIEPVISSAVADELDDDENGGDKHKMKESWYSDRKRK